MKLYPGGIPPFYSRNLRKRQVQWKPVYTVTIGPKKMAVLTGDRMNEGLFTRKCVPFFPGGQKNWPC